MKRLTYRDADGTAMMKKRGGWQGEGIARLAAYEDTGLEPDMIEATINGQITLQKALEKYTQAEEQGHLMELPCKVGDTVYISGREYAAQIDEIVIKANGDITFFWLEYDRGPELEELWDYGEFTPEDIGKTVFLTREEAEAVLLKEGAE